MINTLLFLVSDSAGLLMLSPDDFCRRVWLAGNQGSTSSSSSSCTCRKNLLGRASVTISTISSSRQCRRQYIYACELAAAPFSTPSSPARSTHLMRSTCCRLCVALLCAADAVCWLYCCCWWVDEVIGEKRGRASARPCPLSCPLSSPSALYMHNESAGASSLHVSVFRFIYNISPFPAARIFLHYRCFAAHFQLF